MSIYSVKYKGTVLFTSTKCYSTRKQQFHSPHGRFISADNPPAVYLVYLAFLDDSG